MNFSPAGMGSADAQDEDRHRCEEQLAPIDPIGIRWMR